MHVDLPVTIDFRDFIYLTDTLDKDLRDAEQEKTKAQLLSKHR